MATTEAQRWRILCIASAMLLWPLSARADLFSPGELSNPHKQLEGIKNCTQCHAAGEQLSPAQCLVCHGEIKATLDAGRGLHGKLGAAERASCQSCHHEHQGRDFAIVDFGEGGPKSFDHGRTPFALQGAHASIDCAKCHDNRLVQDPVVKKLLGTKSPQKTFLGLGTSCTSCHFDEHRGQLGNDCTKCHTERFWEPAQKFDHNKTAFKLRGPHAAAACTGCHKSEPDAKAKAFPAPVHPETFARFKPVAHETCAACHKDPHDNRFGPDCASCHVESTWKDQKTTGSAKGPRAFHAKTAFPLRGAHEQVACKLCHGPFGDGRPVKYKGLAHDSCKACHADAHAGQLQGDCASCHSERTFAASSFDLRRHAANFPLEGKHAGAQCGSCHVKDAALKSRSKQLFRLDGTSCAACHADAHAGAVTGDCKSCHTVAAFKPAHFEAEDHTRWPLAGAHGAVACVLCHAKDDKLLAKARQQKKPPRGPWLVRASLTNLRPVDPQARCEACHDDPHRGKFGKEQSCSACHTNETFAGGTFDHAKTGFPLEGKHAAATCAACHGSETRFNKIEAGCASCHAEPHAGQLGNDCARCHTSIAWDPTKFVHGGAFKLDGRHATVKCEACHPKVAVAAGAQAVLYKPRPQSCEGCHADHHRGAFERWAP